MTIREVVDRLWTDHRIHVTPGMIRKAMDDGKLERPMKNVLGHHDFMRRHVEAMAAHWRKRASSPEHQRQG